MAENRFYLASSPHFSMNLSTQKIMLSVIIALLPECIYGVVIFGFSALAVIFTGVLSCVLFELLFQLATRQKLLIRDLSAVVSGILLALSEIEHKNFDISDLVGDKIRTDGSKIYKAIEDNLKRANVSPEVKRDKLLNQFNIIRDNNKINEKNSNLGKTPLRYFTEVLYNSIFTNIKYSSSTEDYIGRFYGEFMSYSGGDGQSLGIILTPRHITDLFCELLDIKPTDKVLEKKIKEWIHKSTLYITQSA